MQVPAAKNPAKVAMLYTAGWANATNDAKAEWLRARDTLAASGIDVQDKDSDAKVAMVEDAISNAMELSMTINAWEGRWPLDAYNRDMDPSGLSESAHGRLKQALAMTQDEFADLLAERDRVRSVYASLKDDVDVCVTLSAPGAAPKGLDWTGDPLFTVPTSLIGMPTVTLPVLQDEGLPLGLQIIGFINQDAELFAHAGGIEPLFQS